MYDQGGFPAGSDNDSGEAFSGNAKDLALVFEAEKGKRYRIFVSGEFSACKIGTALYTGDGTSLGPDSIAER